MATSCASPCWSGSGSAWIRTGAGVLVIGGGKFPDPSLQDEVTTFWSAVDTELLATGMAWVNGATGITNASSTGFALAVVSSDSESPRGGLTDDENDALVGQAATSPISSTTAAV